MDSIMNSTKTQAVSCKRGFQSKEEIMNKIGTGDPQSCNGCNKLMYSQGLCTCEYISDINFMN